MAVGLWCVVSVPSLEAATDEPSSNPTATATTARLALSGSGPSDAVPWRFRLEPGAAGSKQAISELPVVPIETQWSQLPVPSQWQQHRFGRYAYGQNDTPANDTGFYQRNFTVPAGWAGRQIELVFGGAMTDTTAWIDGSAVGPTHQGGFTQFRWDVTDLIEPGKPQRLDVRVSEDSANRSVNRAEREADYWTFGGIYRPVWLEAHPVQRIRSVALDAAASGALDLSVDCTGNDSSVGRLQVRALVHRWMPKRGERPAGANGPLLATAATACREDQPTALSLRVPDAATWSAERPALHTVELILEDRSSDEGPRTLHRVERRFGFRSVEQRSDGLYLNGRRLVLKGANRHSFRPESGRALDPEQNRADVELLRKYHFNAVRTAHSPPDPSFLDACDELGLYVIDELPGWHDAYDTRTGRRMVRELVQRDQHHPSVLFWANGNEGGWNPRVEAEFARWDPQGRIVLRPWAVHNGFQTRHYPSYSDLAEILDERALPSRLDRLRQGADPLVMPTEILHGLYDGGGGAGLADYWQLLEAHPRFAGLFLWALFDEGIERSDRGGAVDTFGNHAPDGLFDPYRQPEASARRVREVFAPVAALDSRIEADGSISVRIANGLHELDLAEVRADVEWFVVPHPLDPKPVAQPTDPALTLSAPAAFARSSFELSAAPPGKQVLVRFDRPTGMPVALRIGEEDPTPHRAPVGARITFRTHTGGRSWEVGRTTVLPERRGLIEQWTGRKTEPSAADTPAAPGAGAERPVDPLGRLDATWVVRTSSTSRYERRPAPPPRSTAAATGDPSRVVGYQTPAVAEALDSIAAYDLSALARSLDVRLCDAEMTWLGPGPDRVWGNRRGGDLGLWRRSLHELCRDPADSGTPSIAPGLYDAYWLALRWPTVEVVLVPEEDVFVGVGAPRFRDDSLDARAALPQLEADSLLLWNAAAAPGIGTKFYDATPLRPSTPGLPPTHAPPAARLLIRTSAEQLEAEP